MYDHSSWRLQYRAYVWALYDFSRGKLICLHERSAKFVTQQWTAATTCSSLTSAEDERAYLSPSEAHTAYCRSFKYQSSSSCSKASSMRLLLFLLLR